MKLEEIIADKFQVFWNGRLSERLQIMDKV